MIDKEKLKEYKFCYGNFKEEIICNVLDNIIDVNHSEIGDWYKYFDDRFYGDESINPRIDTNSLKYNFIFSKEHSLGIDIPTYFGDFNNSKNKIMIVAMDPKRNDSANDIEIGTPFGLHSVNGRNTKRNVYWEFLESLLNSDFVYLTDLFKLYFKQGADDSNNLVNFTSNDNEPLHQQTLIAEIELIKPDKIVIMGTKAWHGLSSIVENDKKNGASLESKNSHNVEYSMNLGSVKGVKVIRAPHLSSRVLGGLKTIGDLIYSYGILFDSKNNIKTGQEVLNLRNNKKSLFN